MAKGTVDLVHSFNNYNNFHISKISKVAKNKTTESSWCRAKGNLFVNATMDTGKFFCRTTTIHALRYIVDSSSDSEEEHRTNAIRKFSAASNKSKYSKPFTKFVFSIGFMVLAGACLYMMSLVYGRYKTNPTVTSIETSNYPIYKVPFPAVTLCNINKVYLPATYNFTNRLSETGIEKSLINDFFEKLSALVVPEFIEGIFLKIYIFLESIGYDSEKLMEELAQPCNNMLKKCYWLSKEIPCHEIFRVIESSQGFCCSFNYHSTQEEYNFFGINSKTSQNFSNFNTQELLYVTGAGRSVGLSVILDVEPESYTSFVKLFYGIDVLIHDPEALPNYVTTVAQPGQDVSISVIPSVTVSDPNIRDLSIEQRLCYFDDERELRNHTKYSFQACMAECKIDTIIELCNCMPFYFPETKLASFNKNFRQCNLRDANCLRNTRHIYSSLAIADIPEVNQTGMKCNCYPTCSERQYASAAVIGQRFSAVFDTALFNNIKLGNLTSVHIYFQQLNCVKYRRDMYMSWDTLFSQFGGIFGLCLGGSVVSIIEFVYTFTFKLWLFTNSKRKPKTKGYPTNSVLSQSQRRRRLTTTNRLFNYNKQKNPFSHGN